MDYLNKVKAHENQQPLAAQTWRKNALNLAGGDDQADQAEFRHYTDGFKARIEKPCFNGKVVNTYTRSSTQGYSEGIPVNIKIDKELNDGLSLITYFGHGSDTQFDLNLGDVTDPTNNYNNTNKYPMLFYNGCAAAALFGSRPTFGENWLLTPDRGAVGLMGETGYGYPGPLLVAQDSLYGLLLNDPQWYGKPVAEVHSEMARRLQADVSFMSYGDIAIEQLLSTVWHADPVLKVYSPALPDFQTSDAQLSISSVDGNEVKATSPKFVLNIAVSNPGNFCTRFDSLEVRVTRSYGSGAARPADVYLKRFKLGTQTTSTYLDTLTNTIVGGVNVFGTNRFLVEINYRRRQPELDYTNNTAHLDYTFLQGGVTILSPPEFAILGSNRPQLVAQTNNPNGPVRGYDFELDTVATFGSPALQRTTLNVSTVAAWQPTLPAVAGRDSVVWYWRVRFAAVTGDENPNWVLSSFRVITTNVGGGWSQSHYAQLQRTARRGLDFSGPVGRWRFTEQRKPLTLRTRGGGLPGSPPNFPYGASFGILADVGATPVFVTCGANSPNLMLAVYDQFTLKPKRIVGPWTVCGTAPQEFYVFAQATGGGADTLDNINHKARQDQLRAFLRNVPDGDYVALVSMNRVRWGGMRTNLRDSLATFLGAPLIRQLANGDPVAVLARKRAGGGSLVHALGPDLSSPTQARYNQVVAFTDSISAPTSQGSVVSTRIGPAQQWQTLHSWITRASATSSYALKVQGVDSLPAPYTTCPATPMWWRGATAWPSPAYRPANTPTCSWPSRCRIR